MLDYLIHISWDLHRKTMDCVVAPTCFKTIIYIYAVLIKLRIPRLVLNTDVSITFLFAEVEGNWKLDK
jgi:hypothetical protein